MSPEWENLYDKAMHEQDAGQLAEACEHARHAINDRVTALAGQGLALEEERERLYEALRALLIHEHNLQPPS
jgi:N-acetylglutamate synthase-like GNAT family acetyltransferase